MTVFYCDAEFNGFGGELISLALVCEDRTVPSFYAVVEFTSPVLPWVKLNVVPHLNQAAESRRFAAERCAQYLRFRSPDRTPVILADWPEDLAHFAQLFMLDDSPGRMVNCPEYDLAYRRLDGFNASQQSRLPHNSLADAEALRDWVEAIRVR